MSRLVVKRFPGQAVVIDRSTRLTVNCVRGDGPQNVAVTLTLAQRVGEDLSTVKFGLSRGNVAPVGSGITVELQRAYGGRCWLLFEGPPEVPILRNELVDGPATIAAAAGPIARMAAAISFAWLGLCLWWSCADEEAGGAL